MDREIETSEEYAAFESALSILRKGGYMIGSSEETPSDRLAFEIIWAAGRDYGYQRSVDEYESTESRGSTRRYR